MTNETFDQDSWMTKPTDRFILKWIKLNLSAPITIRLINIAWLTPGMITVFSTILGMTAGLIFAMGHGLTAGLLAGLSQVMDGVDGQFARLSGRQTKKGAFLDSVLDRYTDGAMVFGMFIYMVKLPPPIPRWVVLIIGALALIGSNLISYSSARASELALDLGRPTLASKGTRMSVTISCALVSVLIPAAPLIALIYLAIHPNIVVLNRLIQASDQPQSR
ncbi:MAG: CDP-alcohol phosphatidyltransferase family protein [Deltaproteobacteria bacterium]|nr:CDP-alcohol phosphatidyltransferase family protein [Deltaproteobacteria bacterium]